MSNDDTLQQIKETITLINSGDALTADKLRAARLEQEHRLEWYAYMLERIEALERENERLRDENVAMILEGLLCDVCGGYIDPEWPGHPRTCEDCEEEQEHKELFESKEGDND